MSANGPLLFISVVTVAEIGAGISKLSRKGSLRKAAVLATQLDRLENEYGDRLLDFDLEAARIAGLLIDGVLAQGFSVPFQDIAIAATARVHGFTVLTRDSSDFARIGVPHHDPFDTLPEVS